MKYESKYEFIYDIIELWYHTYDFIEYVWFHKKMISYIMISDKKQWYHMSNHDIRGTRVPDDRVIYNYAQEQTKPCTKLFIALDVIIERLYKIHASLWNSLTSLYKTNLWSVQVCA